MHPDVRSRVVQYRYSPPPPFPSFTGRTIPRLTLNGSLGGIKTFQGCHGDLILWVQTSEGSSTHPLQLFSLFLPLLLSSIIQSNSSNRRSVCCQVYSFVQRTTTYIVFGVSWRCFACTWNLHQPVIVLLSQGLLVRQLPAARIAAVSSNYLPYLPRPPPAGQLFT